MRPLVLICAVVGVGVGASCTPSSATDESPSPPEADPEGVVFKGPMAEGTDVRITRVDAGLEAVGEPVVATVGASGRYTAAVPSAGIVRLVSEGLAYDEAKAAFSEEATTLRGFGEVGAASAVHLNLLTDLSEARVVALVGEGESFVAATLAAEQAVARALAVGDGRVPDRGAATEVYGDAFDAAWLLAVSSLVSQAGVLREAAGTGTRATVIDDLRAALAAGGPLPDDLAALLAEAERTLDPEIPRLGLEELQRIQGRSERLPALGQVLDSDGDGVVNRDDRCPFDAADDCNHEVLAVAFGGDFGCVVRARDGTLRCWRDDAGPIGGTPPRPDGFPAPPAAPWGDAPGLDGTDYLGVEMGDGIVCASTATSVTCAGGGERWQLPYPGPLLDLAVSATHVCALDAEFLVTCSDRAGEDRVAIPGTHVALGPFGDAGLCTAQTDGALACFDARTGDRLEVGDLPAGGFGDVDGTSTGEGYGCALGADDGKLACFGDPLPAAPPDGVGFVEVAVGEGLACAARPGQPPVCWRDTARCPRVPEPLLAVPGTARRLDVSGCVVCGVDGDDLAHCWPRYWYRRPGARL